MFDVLVIALAPPLLMFAGFKLAARLTPPVAPAPKSDRAKLEMLRAELADTVRQAEQFTKSACASNVPMFSADYVRLSDRAWKRSRELAELVDQLEPANDDAEPDGPALVH